MQVRLFPDKGTLSRAAAGQAVDAIRRALAARGAARIVVATGGSQLEFLSALTKDALTRSDGVDWTKVEAFHLDEYIGMPATHPASFRRMLMEHLVEKTGIVHYHLVPGDAADPLAAVQAVGRELVSAPVDVSFIGIGENGHIAFNDPPANFTTEDPYIVVELDEPCRRQQVGEAWFADISQVPTRALSMSPRQILKAREIISVVPDKRKAEAVKASLEREISPAIPASILRTHPNVTMYLDRDSASLLNAEFQRNLIERQQVVVN